MIRVLRVIEYEYDTVDKMLDDESRWTTSLVTVDMRFQSCVVARNTNDKFPKYYEGKQVNG